MHQRVAHVKDCRATTKGDPFESPLGTLRAFPRLWIIETLQSFEFVIAAVALVLVDRHQFTTTQLLSL
jgi:hypothetical protein